MKKRIRQLVVGSLICTMTATAIPWGDTKIAMFEKKAVVYGAEKETPASESSFVFDKKTGTITGYKGTETGKLVIPEKIDGVQVKVIGQTAFDAMSMSCNFKSVVLPDGLERIEAAAFYGFQLDSIYIPESVTFIEGKKMGFYPFLQTAIIIGESGSYAETWAKENGFEFKDSNSIEEGDSGLQDFYFEQSEITAPIGGVATISVHAPEGAEIEWTLTNRKIDKETEYFAWADEDSTSTTRKIKGIEAVPITPYNKNTVAGTVTAKIKGMDKTISIDVTVDGEATGIELENKGKVVSDTTISLVEGEVLSLEGVSYPIGTNKKVTYTSSDTKVATINSYGTVEAVAEGETTITASIEGGQSASCKIVVAGIKTWQKFTYAVQSDDTVKIMTCNDSGDIVIPDQINGKKVTEIGDYAFRNCLNAVSVTIPESVTKISDKAFIINYITNEMLKVTIYGAKDSAAEKYAIEKELTFKEDDGNRVTNSPEPTTAVTEAPAPTEKVPVTEAPAPTEKVPVTEAPAPTEKVPVTEAPVPTEKVPVTEAPASTEKVPATEAPKPTQSPDAGWSTPAPAKKKASISWSKKVTKIKVGKKYTFKVKKKNTTAKLKWSVSNKKKATISQKGVFKAKKTGKVKVTVKCGKLKKTVTVTIKKK